MADATVLTMPDSALDINEPDLGVTRWYCDLVGIEYNRETLTADLPGHKD